MFARRHVTERRAALLRELLYARARTRWRVNARWLLRRPRDYQFKELFFPHTYGFILLEDIDMQIHLSPARCTVDVARACARVRVRACIRHAAAGIRRRDAPHSAAYYGAV